MIRIKLRAVAKARGLGQRKLSKLADVDLRTVQRIYKNPHNFISTETLDKLATALNVDASLLIESVPRGVTHLDNLQEEGT
ncbi:MAG: helix-turn-helix transcriptional regulator [Ktedonobacteraceae bacterium]